MGLFTSPRETAMEDIYNELKNIKSFEDIQNIYGLKRRKAGDVSQIFNPARANLATRQAQENATAGARMGGSNATPQGTFGRIMSEFAPAWGNLESDASKTGLDVERSDEQTIANMFNNVRGQKANAAGNLSDASTFDDILSVAGTAAKFIPGVGSAASILGAGKKKRNSAVQQPPDYTGKYGSAIYGKLPWD
jgi:hypothetical protein